MGKVLDMCIVHDWGEAVTGDIPSFLKTEADETVENSAVEGLTALAAGAEGGAGFALCRAARAGYPGGQALQSPGQDRGRHPAQRGPARHLDRAREDPEPRVRHGGLRPFPPAARAAGDRRGGHAPQAGRWGNDPGGVLMAEGYVLGIGAANMDVHGKSRVPIVMRDSNPGHLRTSAGGVTRNVLENLSRLGVRTKLVSAVGADLYGEMVLRSSAAAGIDISGVVTIPGAASSCYISVLDQKGDMLVAMSTWHTRKHHSGACSLPGRGAARRCRRGL